MAGNSPQPSPVTTALSYYITPTRALNSRMFDEETVIHMLQTKTASNFTFVSKIESKVPIDFISAHANKFMLKCVKNSHVYMKKAPPFAI